MSDKSKISWTDFTWNTIAGCSPVSAACSNCYARGMHKRLKAMGSWKYQNDFSEVVFHDNEKLLTEPIRMTKPRMIFVNSMSDTFHEKVPESFIRKIYESMIAAPQHIFQVLTKRPERMCKLVGKFHDEGWLNIDNNQHIYHGVTVEDSKSVDYRIYPYLLNTPSLVRFVSAEPLLEDWLTEKWCNGFIHVLDGIDWLIIGGESGPNARRMELDWLRTMLAIVEAYNAKGDGKYYPCKVFIKQLGSVWARENGSKTSKGEDMSEWPKDLRIQEMPCIQNES